MGGEAGGRAWDAVEMSGCVAVCTFPVESSVTIPTPAISILQPHSTSPLQGVLTFLLNPSRQSPPSLPVGLVRGSFTDACALVCKHGSTHTRNHPLPPNKHHVPIMPIHPKSIP